MIAFTAAIQWVSFDKINGLAYTNLFTTGNLKGVATNLYDYLATKNSEAKSRFVHFLLVVLAFIAGAIVSVFSYRMIGTDAVLIIAGLFNEIRMLSKKNNSSATLLKSFFVFND